jgi:peptide deformylase
VTARDVLLYPHPLLKEVCSPATAEDAGRVTADLLDTMAAHPGCVGLAAPQIGEPVRIVVVDVSEHPRAETSNGLLVLVNPRLTASSGSVVRREGCLSIPDLTANVRRAERLTVETRDAAIESEGFEARCLLHELDHLDGVLFLDRVDSLATDVFRRKTYQ